MKWWDTQKVREKIEVGVRERYPKPPEVKNWISSRLLVQFLCAMQDSFTLRWPSLIKHPCLAYLPIGAIIFTPLCPHQHKCYLLTMSPSLTHLFCSALRLHHWSGRFRGYTGPQSTMGSCNGKSSNSNTPSLPKWFFPFNSRCWQNSKLDVCTAILKGIKLTLQLEIHRQNN